MASKHVLKFSSIMVFFSEEEKLVSRGENECSGIKPCEGHDFRWGVTHHSWKHPCQYERYDLQS